ncbi:MAG: serine/threonine-protein kinase [Cyanobacteria bacterium J06631_9]
MNTGGGLGLSGSQSNSLLGEQYRIIRELGQTHYGHSKFGYSEFGQAYLAKALSSTGQSSDETLYAIREFLPQVVDAATLTKAKALFDEKASAFYELRHGQVSQVYPLLQVDTETSSQLFFRQEYIEGTSYAKILQTRQRANAHFRETEISQLLYELLPVLSHCHHSGIVHKDICPENVVLRQNDGAPVLINFGSLQEIAAAVRAQLGIEGAGTAVASVGTAGYVPPEQFATESVDHSRDLYGLAATLLVLATGKAAKALHDPSDNTWTGFEHLTPELGRILKRMLSAQPNERYSSADAVLAALSDTSDAVSANASAADAVVDTPVQPIDNNGSFYSDDGPIDNTFVTVETDDGYEETLAVPMMAVGGAVAATGAMNAINTMGELDAEAPILENTTAVRSTYETIATEANTHEPVIPADGEGIIKNDSKQALYALLILLGTIGTILLFGWARLLRSPSAPAADNPVPARTPVGETVDYQEGDFSIEESIRRQEIRSRREALAINQNTFDRLIDQRFYTAYPDLERSGPGGGRKALSNAPEDEPLRIRWDHIALETLEKLENNFSQRSLDGLGNYSGSDRTRWQSQIDAVNASMRSLDDLTDAKFISLFGPAADDNFLEKPTGQLYYAIAEDKARAIASGGASENIQIGIDNITRQDLNGRLSAGEGRVYTLQLTAGQILRLNLNAPSDSTLFSLYRPNGQLNDSESNTTIFADSEQVTWSGNIDQTGYYEIVVVNRSAQPIDFQLAASVDSVVEPPAAAETEPTENSDLPPVPAEDNSETDTEQTDESTETTEGTDNAETNSEETTESN